MLIFFACSRCKNPLSVNCQQAGNPMLCPTCKAEIIIPSSSEIAPPQTEPIVVQPIAIPTAIRDAVATPILVSSTPRPPKQRSVKKPVWMDWRLGWAACATALLLVVTAGWSATLAWSKWHNRMATQSELPIGNPAETPTPGEGNPPNGGLFVSSAPGQALEPGEHESWQALPALARLSSQQMEEEEATIAGGPPAVAKVKANDAPLASGKIVVKHRKELTEEDLRKQLIWAPEVGLTAPDIPPIIHQYMANLQGAMLGTEDLCQEPTFILRQRPDLKSLPLRRGRASRLDPNTTLELHVLSKELHLLLDKLAAKKSDGSRPTPVLLAEFMKQQTRGRVPEWLRPEAVPALLQIMMTDDQPVRILLVELLAAIEGKQASTALAQRAVFDLSVEVREAAVRALRERPRVEFRHALVDALRYPWAPAADHAAEALVALADREAAPLLVRFLREPDPSTPVEKHEHYYKREIVRLKHVDNCLACHPPAIDGTDPIQGAVPGFNFLKVSVKQETTSTGSGSGGGSGGGGSGGGGGGSGGGGSTGGGGYGGSSGSSSGSSGTGGASGVVQVPVSGRPGQSRSILVSRPGTKTTVDKKEIPLTIRADITYLRQDFSVLQPVVVTDLSRPEQLRFDYVIRLRPLTQKQTKEWKSQLDKPSSYEQREAVLFALRELTGLDAGSISEAWEQLYPTADFDSRTAELSTSLVEAPDYGKDAVIKQLKDSKGVVYSQALAQAIPQLSGKYQEKARLALVERMKRMTAATLRNKLMDEDRETRYAAAVACGCKDDKTLVRDLNDLLDDAEPVIAAAAQTSMKSLGGPAAARELNSGSGTD